MADSAMRLAGAKVKSKYCLRNFSEWNTTRRFQLTIAITSSWVKSGVGKRIKNIRQSFQCLMAVFGGRGVVPIAVYSVHIARKTVAKPYTSDMDALDCG